MGIWERLAGAWAALVGGRKAEDVPVTKSLPEGQDVSQQAAVIARQGQAHPWPVRGDGAQAQYWGRAGEPYLPHESLEEPLYFDYPWGTNLIAQPRAGFGLLSFGHMRNLAKYCQEVRLPIEVMKREVRALEWDIVPRKGFDKNYEDILAARERVEMPDGTTPFDSWINTLLEEVLVVDAATLYPHRTRGGDTEFLDVIDGTTIRPLLNAQGRVPRPPMPGYVQVIKGVPEGSWTQDELWYVPYNGVTHHPYGYSAVEMIILTVNTALRRAGGRLAGYTEGNVPEALVGLPKDWTVDQIEAYQEYFDALLAGDQTMQRRLKFHPTDGSQIPVHEFSRDDGKIEMDEWLLRVGCWAVGVSPMEFGLTPGGGLGGKGYAEGQADIQYRMGLGPLAQYLATIVNRVLAVWGFRNLRFRWVSLQVREDALKQAQTDQIYINAGVRRREDVAEDHGWEAPEDWEPPRAGGGLFGLSDRAGGLRKAAELGEDDPDFDFKEDLVQDLRSALLEYLADLQARVVRAVEGEGGDGPTA